jgi:hypothetical protein
MLNKNMKRNLCILAAALALTLAACSSTQYATYSGSPALVGQGGASRQVQGLDVWLIGTPPRPYQVIGYIKDYRYEGNWKSSSLLPSAVVAQARAAGADGIIINSDRHDFAGTFSSANVTGWANGYNFGATGWGMIAPLYERNSTFLVIKYLNAPASGKIKGT